MIAVWVKLKHGNSCGADYWAINPLNAQGCAEFSHGMRVTDGERILIRFEDGTIAGAVVRKNGSDRPVSDMTFETVIHGSTLRIDPAQVYVERDWAEKQGAK